MSRLERIFLDHGSHELQTLQQLVGRQRSVLIGVRDQKAVDQAFEESGCVVVVHNRQGNQLIEHDCICHLEEMEAEPFGDIGQHNPSILTPLFFRERLAVSTHTGQLKPPPGGAAEFYAIEFNELGFNGVFDVLGVCVHEVGFL